jgi:hypothetical protein
VNRTPGMVRSSRECGRWFRPQPLRGGRHNDTHLVVASAELTVHRGLTAAVVTAEA